jgi:hypothetical protein
VAPADKKYGCFTELNNVDTLDKVVMEDDLYINSLRKDIHNFLVATVEKEKKKHILGNQNQERN